MSTDPIQDTEEYRDKVATVDDRGKRIWIYPKKPSGRYYNARKWVSYVLLAILFGLPFIEVGGEPFVLFNILERKFILFGVLFMPQDFHLFVLAMLTFIVFIVLFTVVWGRVFCGWICPQTIFMEMVFRRIEYWIEGDANAQRRLNKAPWTTDKIFKKTAKQVIFFTISVLIANVFLAYIISLDEVLRIVQEPISQNWEGFVAMILFSGAFYFVFSYMREQVCIAVCPYGRLQGVMLDNNSIVVHYDHVRGEPRGKMKKKHTARKPDNPVQSIAATVAAGTAKPDQVKAEAMPTGSNPTEQIKKTLGDCIDCKLCVQVCPTGIDIRDGTQLECVNCTACMDACDEVMDKIGRERGLIRYDSFKGISEGRKRLWTPRVMAYSAVLGVLIVVNILLLNARTDVEANLFRATGTLFYQVNDQPDQLRNLYNYQITNKTKESFPVEFRLVGIEGSIELVGKPPVTEPGAQTEGSLFITLDKADLDGRKTRLSIDVYSGDKRIDRVKTNFFGPVQ